MPTAQDACILDYDMHDPIVSSLNNHAQELYTIKHMSCTQSCSRHICSWLYEDTAVSPDFIGTSTEHLQCGEPACNRASTSMERPAVAASSAICTASSSGGRPAKAASAQDEELVVAFDTSSSYVVAEGAAALG